MQESTDQSPQCKAVIFDLDGTLVNTLEDIADSVNHVLQQRGLPTHPTEAFRLMVGDGSRKLIERCLPAEKQDDVDQVLSDYQAHYRTHLLCKTAPYPGIPAMLTQLCSAGLKLAVLSNKPDQGTCQIVEALFPPGTFQVVRGHREGSALKPDPASAREIMTELNTAPAETVFVGDTSIDMRTATAAGLKAIGVTWGFRSAEELTSHGAWQLADSAEMIPPLLSANNVTMG